MKNAQKVLGVLLMATAATGFAMAIPGTVPEIAPGTAGSAVALVSGIVLMVRGRHK